MVRMLCAYMGVQARTGVRSNVRNTIIVSGQEEPLPEFYFPAESSGAYLCLCLHTHECALSLSRCRTRSSTRSCLHKRGFSSIHSCAHARPSCSFSVIILGFDSDSFRYACSVMHMSLTSLLPLRSQVSLGRSRATSAKESSRDHSGRRN